MKKLINFQVEILPVILGIKPVSHQEINPRELNYYIKKLNELGLYVTCTTWKKYVEEKAKHNSYPNEVDDNRNKGYTLIYFSKDEKKAELAKKYDSTNQHAKFGLLLGYPVCCIKAFESNFINSKIKNPYVAYTLCSKNCKKTKIYINKFKKIIKLDI